MQHELGERLLSYPLISPEVGYPLPCQDKNNLNRNLYRYEIAI